MGYIKNKAIVITSCNSEDIQSVAEKTRQIGMDVLGPSTKAINGCQSLFIPPCGSKAGWPEAEEFEGKLTALIAFMNDFNSGFRDSEDGSSSLEWVLISYGNDDQGAEITDHAWQYRIESC